jgi:hypothetical protein
MTYHDDTLTPAAHYPENLGREGVSAFHVCLSSSDLFAPALGAFFYSE